MFSGKNESGKQFDAINEDREVIGSFDAISEAVACCKSAHWTQGQCDIRRDIGITASLRASYMSAPTSRDFELDRICA